MSQNNASSILSNNELTTYLLDSQYLNSRRILTAYLEPVNQTSWVTRPLPIREIQATGLSKISYPRLRSCSKLPQQWPVDDYPDEDPFLPVSAAT
jgi:hypothetical protein